MKLVDATVERLRTLVKAHPERLRLVEEGPADANDGITFRKYHRVRFKAFARKRRTPAALEKLGELPQSYRHFLERYGSLTILGRRQGGVEPLDGFWVGNVTGRGWAVLEVLDAARAKEVTLTMRGLAEDHGGDLSNVL